MRKGRRLISTILLVCMIVTLMPQMPRAAAASGATYVLDTDGVDYGAEYLIVSGTDTTSYAFSATGASGGTTAVTVTDGTTIQSFTGEDDCLWTVEEGTNSLKHGNVYLNIPTSSQKTLSFQSTSYALDVADKGNGGYGFYKVSSGLNFYQLYWNSKTASYTVAYTYGKSNLKPVYLFKKEGGAPVTPNYTISFNSNGATHGTLPETPVELLEGSEYIVPSPSQDFRIEINGDTYLFWCWTENRNGVGTEYRPGDRIIVDRDMELYAQWYLQTKYKVTVITDLNDVPTDMDEITGEPVEVLIRLDQEGSPYLPLTREEEGVYTTKVAENGTYFVYTKHGDEEPHEEHGYKVVIFNQDGTTELLNYSMVYQLNGGTVEAGLPTVNYHANTRVTATELIPTLAGNRFLGWEDQHGNLIAPGGLVTEALLEKTVLTAKWEKLVNVTVNITVDHTATNGKVDSDAERELVAFLLQQKVGEANQPYGEIQHLVGGETNGEITYYTVRFTDLPRAVYTIGCEKSHYTATLTTSGTEDDQILDLVLTYAPETFDLQFQVKVQVEGLPAALRPQSVNVRVTRWEDGRWQDVEQQADATPITVILDENGVGTGFLPVWKEDDQGTCFYRVRVSSFVMPDGTVVRSQATEADLVYKPESSGLYTAQVTVPNGQTPAGAQIPGAYYAGTAQVGMPVVEVTVSPYTVTFDAGAGKLNMASSVVLHDQYQYPDLNGYIPVANEEYTVFAGWYVNGQPAQNLAGQYLTEDVTYVAMYKSGYAIRGTIHVESSYMYNGKLVTLALQDRAQKVLVILQKNINGVYNDVDSRLVTIDYTDELGLGNYVFDNLPNDGTTYRITTQKHNYDVSYDHDADENYSKDEASVTEALRVDVHMEFDPVAYAQDCIVDASAIAEGFRPKSAVAQILYRDLGDVLPYNLIAQHKVEPYGVPVQLGENGKGSGTEVIWCWHNNGSLYEYQMDVTTFYGQVAGVFTEEGVEFSENMPFTIQYSLPSYFIEPGKGETADLKATLIPKEYKVTFDMNLNGDTTAEILGMEKYLVDGGNEDQYAYYHTWSFGKNLEAFPYREGWVFQGWKSDHDGVIITDSGYIHIGAELAEDITLTAIWKELKGTDYTVRHLELNTDDVLLGARAVSGVQLGSSITAVSAVEAIEGYVYAGAMIDGVYYDKTTDPALILTNDPAKNLMVIYYLPDGSDGYTEQVESNIYLNKEATLQNDGTYTVLLETYTKDSPITTQILQNTPLDIVLVLDQSGSIETSGSLGDLKDSVSEFIDLIASHGGKHEVDHRLAIVGYASDAISGYTKPEYPTAGSDNGYMWVNTGVFDSNGDFHVYPVTGFNYSLYDGEIKTDGTYYTYADGEYLLMTYHEAYRHLITEEEARKEVLEGTTIYGYVGGQFVELTRNTSGLWLYGDKQLYSLPEFFTYHKNVWTHRKGTEPREIHAYMADGKYVTMDGHAGVYIRTETREAEYHKSIYVDALVPVSMSAGGAGNVNPGLLKATEHIGANGTTFVSYGMEMANRIFEANPLDEKEGRIRIVVVLTDGKPGDSSNFDETEANKAIAQSYITHHTYGADVYTVGVYGEDVVNAESDQDYFMNGLSSNYPDAKNMDDVWLGTTFQVATSGYRLDNGGPYFVEVNGEYYALSLISEYTDRVYYNCWGYTDAAGERVTVSRTPVEDKHPVITDGKVAGQTIYRRVGNGYQEKTNSGYYTVAENAHVLKQYFADIVASITTKVTTKITLYDDTILRDIMGQGLVLTPGTEIIAYKQAGTYNTADNTITWSGVNKEVARVVIPQNPSGTIYFEQTTDVSYFLPDGTEVVKPNTPYISVHNLDSANPTDPKGENYHPHTVDVTGYDFTEWYISETNPNGYKMVVTISRIEARDDVSWGRAQDTNSGESGVWLPMDANGNRELLLPFDQPSTIFVERAYVLDYGKEFELSDWYFDSEDGKMAQAIHLDCDIKNGMNWFDVPNRANGGEYGNTQYGNVRVEGGKVYYQPVTTQWGGYDQFYVFGNTWRKTVLAQDANENGNLWNKVTVIPANNIYYEDSFVTGTSTGVNEFSGFVYTGDWQTVFTDDDPANAGLNKEHPEHLENTPYGDVHGWTDSLGDDLKYSDGSAHMAGMNGTMGARAEFVFTGTGVDVYTRTNQKTGIVIAMLSKHGSDDEPVIKSFAMDNLAMSGDYYQIPTVSFADLSYGTYQVTLIATAAGEQATGEERYEYYLDGIRVYNPLGNVMNAADAIVRDVYDKELNAVFTEIRDVMLKYDDFTPDLENTGAIGAVFIDWIRPGQESGEDVAGIGRPTYEVGTTFKTYGPKNEVYLSKGQAVVIKVDPSNTYFVGMKTITPGKTALVNVSGITLENAQKISVSHTTDMYYEVVPMDGYIVIQNASEDGALLSLTKLRTTNMYASSANSGILSVLKDEAVAVMDEFSKQVEEVKNAQVLSGDALTEHTVNMANQLFTTVRTWLEDEPTGEETAQ